MKRFGRFLWTLEQAICYGALVLLALIPLAEVITRAFFKTGVPESSKITAHLLLVLGLFGGMITTKQGEHLSISLTQYIRSEKVKAVCAALTGLVSLAVSVVVFWISVSYVRVGLVGNSPVGVIPVWILGSVIPLGYAVMSFRFARQTAAALKAAGLKGQARFLVWLLPVLVCALGTLLAFPSITKLLWGFEAPDAAWALTDKLYEMAYTVRIPVVILLVLSALAGAPLFLSIGGLAILLLVASWGEMETVTHEIYVALTNSSIIAIPLFTLAGFILSESRAGERLVKTFRSLFGWLPGGMIIGTVIICAFFTSFTGASGVTILALGGLLYSILSEHAKYPEKFSIGLLTSVGSIGLLFPPSLPLILVGSTSFTNIIHMFVGGIVPGFILVLAMIIFGIVVSVRTKIPVEKFNLRELGRSLKGSLLEILLPIILIVGFFTGTFSLVETGAIAVIYIFLVEVLIHRDIKVPDMPKVFLKALPIIGGVLSILAMSQALSYYIVDTKVPENFAIWLHTAIQSKYLFLLLLNVALLAVGCLMDIFSAILIVLPLIIPLGTAYGIDPVHLGIIFITNLELGFLTPPIGLNLFLASYRFKKSYMDICRYVFPFLLIQLAVVLLVTYVPALSTFLTRFF
ncbi:MAG: TRAP transporter large permease subunit [Treponema sp.]|jgi:tripartite ATP-independent transporter DctM subunit|nr:TRAP transporter large permease subunit [Treponema sp.]